MEAGRSQVVFVVPFAAEREWLDVVDGCCVECASWKVDLAGVSVSDEYAASDGFPAALIRSTFACVSACSHLWISSLS